MAVLNEDYERKSAIVGEKIHMLEKQIVLQILDNLWKEHLAAMDQLRQGIFLRSYAGKNPKQEYKREAFSLFQELLSNLQHEVVRFLSHVQIRTTEEIEALERQREEERAREKMKFEHAQALSLQQEVQAVAAQLLPQQAADNTPFVRDDKKVGRNDPCFCGSGKKLKQCHGRLS